MYHLQDPNDSVLTTPVKMTPVKSATFSPSHFLNSPQPSFDHLTSTPMFAGVNPQSQSTPVQSSNNCLNNSTQSLNTPTNIPLAHTGSGSGQLQTPKSRRTLIKPAPKTPTPIKNALREMAKKNSSIKTFQTPTHYENVEEMIREDTDYKDKFETPITNTTITSQSSLYDSAYGTLKRKANVIATGKENSPNKKARKSLVHSWPSQGAADGTAVNSNQPMTSLPETPVSSNILKFLFITS